MSDTKGPSSQLEQLREEKSLLNADIKEKRRRLSLLEDGEADPRHKTVKTDLLFLVARRKVIHSKIRYRELNNVENAMIHKSSGKGARSVLNEFEEERDDMRIEITELRALISSERRKKQTSKVETEISQLEDSLVDLLAERDKTSAKIRYHRRKLKK